MEEENEKKENEKQEDKKKAGRKKAERITEEQKNALLANLERMKQCFAGAPFKKEGEELHQVLRKVKAPMTEKEINFAAELKEKYPVLHKALFYGPLPGHANVKDFSSGKIVPTKDFVEVLTDFCKEAFAVDETFSTQDLLERELNPFPRLRRIADVWGRYIGIYRAFYFYPESLEGDEQELHGALLQLKENRSNGGLQGRIITGVRRDKRFAALQQLLEDEEKGKIENFYEAFRAYNDSLPVYEARMVCYEGEVDFTYSSYFFLRMDRVEHRNSLTLLLRRWDRSAQTYYSGGIGAVTVCRSDGVTCYPMAVTREPFSLEKERPMLERYLRRSQVESGVPGILVSRELDKRWNRAVMEWCCRNAEDDEE